MITLEYFAGMHISSACKEAVDRANSEQEQVRFEFNGTEVIASPWRFSRGASSHARRSSRRRAPCPDGADLRIVTE